MCLEIYVSLNDVNVNLSNKREIIMIKDFKKKKKDVFFSLPMKCLVSLAYNYFLLLLSLIFKQSRKVRES